jgi:fluoroacetyl-CoA thioesterase
MSAAVIRPGMQGRSRHRVTELDTARALGSGDLAVLGTPRLVAWLEAATCAAVDDVLGADETTVGTRVAVEHLKPTPVGGEVVTTATVHHVDGRLLRFDVVAEQDDGVVVGYGEITRVRVDRARFLARVPPPSAQ